MLPKRQTDHKENVEHSRPNNGAEANIILCLLRARLKGVYRCILGLYWGYSIGYIGKIEKKMET